MKVESACPKYILTQFLNSLSLFSPRTSFSWSGCSARSTSQMSLLEVNNVLRRIIFCIKQSRVVEVSKHFQALTTDSALGTKLHFSIEYTLNHMYQSRGRRRLRAPPIKWRLPVTSVSIPLCCLPMFFAKFNAPSIES